MRETVKFARIATACAIAVLFIVNGVARAHHAFAAEFDVNRPIKLRGTVTKMDWINPHSWIHIDVKDADGKVTGWMIEGGSPNSLLRLGFTKDALPAGSEIVVDGFQAKDGTSSMWTRSVKTADGRRMFAGNADALPPSAPAPPKDDAK